MCALFDRNCTPDQYMQDFGRVFKNRWYQWEPETLWKEIHREYGVDVVEKPGVTDKINAIRVFHTTDRFWDDPQVFENIVIAFNNEEPNPDVIEVCTPAELIVGLTLATAIKKKKFDHDVLAYINACMREAGMIAWPVILREYKQGYSKQALQDAERIESMFDQKKEPDKNNLLDWVQYSKLALADAEARSRLK